MPSREAIAAQIKKLQDQLDAPEPGPVGRVINATINLGDPKQVALAIKHGFLDPDEPDPTDPPESDEGDDTPKRRGYFKD